MSLEALAGRKTQQDSEPGLCVEWGCHVQGSKCRNKDAHNDLGGNNITLYIHASELHTEQYTRGRSSLVDMLLGTIGDGGAVKGLQILQWTAGFSAVQ